MTIEQLEALERAETQGVWIAGDMGNGWPSIYVGYSEILGNLGQEWMQDGNGNATESVWETYDFIAAARNAMPHLLAVAKAAKCYTNADPMVRGEAYRDLCEALARLEAQ